MTWRDWLFIGVLVGIPLAAGIVAVEWLEQRSRMREARKRRARRRGWLR